MTTDATGELTRLRKIAYGRTNGVDGERAAADARRQLHALEAAAVTESTARSLTEPDVFEAAEFDEAHADFDLELSSDPAPHVMTRPRKPWLWAAIAAAMVACFGLGFAVATALQSPTDVIDVLPTEDVSQSEEPVHQATPEEMAEAEFRLGAALAQFARAQTAADRSYDPAMITTLEYAPDTVRIVGSTELGDVFAARNSANEICLIAVAGTEGWASSCAPESEFGAQGGLGLGFNSLFVFWDGINVTGEQIVD